MKENLKSKLKLTLSVSLQFEVWKIVKAYSVAYFAVISIVTAAVSQ